MAGRVALGGSSVERAETGWDRPSESAPRWRALLDRALLGRTGEQAPVNGTQIITPRSPATYEPGSYLPPADYERPELRTDFDRPGGYDRPDAGQPGLDRPDWDRPEYGRPEFGRPEFGRPEYGRPEFGRPEFGRPGYDGPPYGPADYERAGYDHGAGYPPQSPYPAQVEWRQPQANGAEIDRDIDVLRRDLGNPRVIAFANPKGGVHKTTATVLAAATVGSVRGRGVLAWDDNELRGTLGLRAGSARHARTIRHLIADLAEVESSQGAYLVEQLDQYLRHASDGSYDVLAGEENPRFAQRLDQFTVRRVLQLLRRTHDVICVDTGNNVESANWQTVLQVADQLVLTTVPREDAAFSADWMLDLLEEIGLGHLVADAVTLLSCPTPNPTPLLEDLASHFGARTRAVAVVPYDPALEAGSSIEYEMLQPETKKAWLGAAAMMLEPFAR
jgi:MinD-like ATPase involved in chromosome partitioning or flagellar assembly